MSGLTEVTANIARRLRESRAREAPNIEALRRSMLAKLEAIVNGEELPSVRGSTGGMGYAVDANAVRESLRRKLIPELYMDEEDHTDEAQAGMQEDAAGAS